MSVDRQYVNGIEKHLWVNSKCLTLIPKIWTISFEVYVRDMCEGWQWIMLYVIVSGVGGQGLSWSEVVFWGETWLRLR